MQYCFLCESNNAAEILKPSLFPHRGPETFQNNLHALLQLHFRVAGSKSLKAQLTCGQKIKNIDSVEAVGRIYVGGM